eukprot:18980_4
MAKYIYLEAMMEIKKSTPCILETQVKNGQNLLYWTTVLIASDMNHTYAGFPDRWQLLAMKAMSMYSEEVEEKKLVGLHSNRKIHDNGGKVRLESTSSDTSTKPAIQATLSGVNGYLILFGGNNPNTEYPNNALWTYNTDAESWTSATPAKTPAPRQRHFSVNVAQDSFVMFGGLVTVGSQYLANDLWIFNTTSLEWVCLSEHS